MRQVALNVDVGEGFPFDDDLCPLADWGNVCCGAHAGSAPLAAETALKWLGQGRRVGAHPGYPHRESMGRLTWAATGLGESETLASLLSQTELLLEHGADYLKPHGAFYNDSTREGGPAEMLAEVVKTFMVPVVGLSGSLHEELAAHAGVEFLSEGFADRRYRSDGTLAPRSEPGSVIEDLVQVESQTIWLHSRVDTVCVHGDHSSCLAVAKVVRGCLDTLDASRAP